jgi:hypothetical protein
MSERFRNAPAHEHLTSAEDAVAAPMRRCSSKPSMTPMTGSG